MARTDETGFALRAYRAFSQVGDEFFQASAKFPSFNSPHEAFAVLKEEVDELWDEVKARDSTERTARMRSEAVQVAAMALRFLTDIK